MTSPNDPPRPHSTNSSESRDLVDLAMEDLAHQAPAVDELTSDDIAAIEPEKSTGRVVALLGVLMGAALIAMLNETALSVALPDVMATLHIDAATGQWLTTGFMLTMAVVIPTTGFLIQRFSTRTLFIASLGIFIAGTAVAAIAPTFLVLLLGRVLQAAGTAIILPQLMATALAVVPANNRGSVMGLIAVVMSAAPTLGPTLSGFVVQSLSWRWLFIGVLPLAILLLAIGAPLVKTDGTTRRPPFDVLSVLLSAVGFGGLVYGLSSIQRITQGDVVAAVVAVVGVIGVALFVWRQVALSRSTGAPLLDLAPFANPSYRMSVAVVCIAMATMLGTVIVLPLHLQGAMLVSAAITGLATLPGGLLQGVISPLAGRIYDLAGPRPLAVPGTVMLAAGTFWLSRADENSALWEVIGGHSVLSIGMALTMSAFMTHALGSLPPHLYGHGTAILNTLQQLAGAAGTAILVAAMTFGMADAASGGAGERAAQTAGSHTAFLVATGLALVGVVLSLFVRRSEPGQVADEPAPEAAVA
ncbi:MDR family MFS transporter [Kribbia dieselivorans]|uniref:MDR family MFS transporter n=1 Tax=Kribbia dieselivorans TaxID=331526 RepID=UPI000B14E134|nr:MDR family MFS transporter [Kribbia dieselivorans]